jgi:hypothetical protein
MEKFIDDNTRVIIVAIENYRYDKISRVKYALNDAEAFKELMISEFKVNPDNIKIFLDKYATKTSLEDELIYEIRNLKKDDRFIFYYAGHGFYGDGTNKLTAWDTSDTNFSETTIPLREILINPLTESECKKSLIFLDTCSKYLSEEIISRDAILNINDKELEYLIEQSEYCATFISCSPGEKSYSDENLQHGIWTYHLLEALKGNQDSLLVDDKYITDTSLRDYLRRSVPNFISENTDIRDSQTPYAKVDAANSFVIQEIQRQVAEEKDTDFPSLGISYNKIKLLNISTLSVKEATGYKSSHWPPDKVSSSGEHFIRNAFEQNTSDEIQNVYRKTKDILGLRRKEIKKEIAIAGGIIQNKIFDYKLTVSQNTTYPAYGQFDRELTINDFKLITPEFDDVFEVRLQSLMLDCDVAEDDYEDIVEQFENLADSENGKVIDDDRNLTITYTAVDGMVLILKVTAKKIFITTKRNYRIRDFLERTESIVNSISKNKLTF